MTNCQNVVTPKMIKAGQISVGDYISLEDEVLEVHGPAPTMVSQSPNPSTNYDKSPNSNPWVANNAIPNNNWSNNESTVKRVLPYEEMTAYMTNTMPSGTMENPSVVLPQSPLSPNGYQEEIDNTALQSFNGFLRTQIGRYMRVQQLVTSDRTEDRLGFLVGVGSNFIILQDITTGNILVIDIFSIRLTYVYYSPAIVPEF